MKKCFLLIFILFLNNSLSGQYQITGQVFSSKEKPIEFATVSIYPIADSTNVRGVITKHTDGTFIIPDLERGNYQLIIQMLAYEDWEQEFSVTGDIALGKITLKDETTLLETVEVVAAQSSLESRLGKKVLRIGQDLSTTGSNALEALESIPSVTTTQKGQVQIRGNSNVIIYINGKETQRDPSTLKYVSAESLEKIEIITNPSAKYDAEGIGGIINLVYKKGKNSEFKMEVISSAIITTDPYNLSPSIGLNASLSKDRLSFFTNASLDFGPYTDYFDSQRINFADSLAIYENHVTKEGSGSIANINLGLTFELDSTSSMGLEVNYDRWDFIDESNQTNIFKYQNAATTMLDFAAENGELENELWVNYTLEKTFKGDRKIVLGLTAGGEDEDNYFQSNTIDFVDQPNAIQQFLLKSDEQEKQRYYQGKLDFETPFFKMGTLEGGVKVDLINYDILQKATLQSQTIMLPDNDFSMDMQKIGLYLLQNHQIKKLEYSLGLRLEQFSSDAIQRSDQSTFTLNYLRLFPSVQFNYWLPDQTHTIGFNYTRRIKKPSFFDINPFVSYSDPLNLETGNPNLRPEIANLYEVAYHKSWDPFSVDITLYKRVTKDAIQSIVKSIGNNQSLESPVNFAEQSNQGIEAQIEYEINKLINTTASFVLGEVAYSDPDTEITFDKTRTWSTRLKQQFKLINNWKIELTQTYRAPSFSAQEKSHENFYINLSINKKFNNKRGSISFAVHDMFNTRQYAYSFLTSEFEVEKIYKWQTRKVILGLRYYIFNGK